MQYSDFQNQVSSEKITLCILMASSRLMGWTLHSGSIYKIEGLNVIVDGIEDSGTAYAAVGSIGAVTASKYFYDTDGTLYLRTTGSDNPNGRFIVLRQKLCFSNVPVVLPHDLNTAEEVEFVPILRSTSQFGVSIDVIAQDSEAIEGSGTVTLINDLDFWRTNYDRLFFDNQVCSIYSYNRNLAPSEAYLIFKGRVERRSYSPTQIQLSLKDQFSELKAPVALATIADLGERTTADLAIARQRMIIGNVRGHRPVNLDAVLDGYPLTGTVSIAFSDINLTGSGTAFLTELAPDDQIIIDDVTYTIATVTSDTAATLTEEYASPLGATALAFSILPNRPKRYINREWIVAGHAVREPVTTTQNGSSIIQLMLDDASDIEVGDMLYVGDLGSGELVKVDSLIGDQQVRLSTSLASIPPIGTAVRRPAIQNVRINSTPLTYFTDYTFDAPTARLSLRDTAEANAGAVKQMSTNLTFTSGSRNVTGTGIKNTILPGYMVGAVGSADFFEVLSVESDTALTLTSLASTSITGKGLYKSLLFDPDEDVLSLDSLGRTVDGTSGGALIATTPDAVKALLTDAGLGSNIATASFDDARNVAYQKIGIVVPTQFTDSTVPTYRELINKINKSTFCSLIQNADFEFALEVLQPAKPTSAPRFGESDILSMSFTTTAENMVKTARVSYAPKEYDFLTSKPSVRTHQKTSDISSFILKTTRERVLETFLVNSPDALIHANRWAYLLENTAGRIVFQTKLQGVGLEIGDIIEVEHRKMFQRFGGSDNRRLMFVESVRKSGSGVEIEATDLSNSFNRIASINEASAEFASASLDEKLFGGYYSDEFGLIDNDPQTTGTNLIW